MVKVIVEMKGYHAERDKFIGTFEGFTSEAKHLENKEHMRLHHKEWDVVYECPINGILRYWHKNKWVYIAHKKHNQKLV